MVCVWGVCICTSMNPFDDIEKRYYFSQSITSKSPVMVVHISLVMNQTMSGVMET